MNMIFIWLYVGASFHLKFAYQTDLHKVSFLFTVIVTVSYDNCALLSARQFEQISERINL